MEKQSPPHVKCQSTSAKGGKNRRADRIIGVAIKLSAGSVVRSLKGEV